MVGATSALQHIGKLDDTLALLSLDVAQEVDIRLKGLTSNNEGVFRELGEHLSKVSGLEQAPAMSLLHSDPLTTEVFARAVDQVTSEPISDVEALASAMRKIIKPLLTQDLQAHDLRLVKAFCLALHRAMMGTFSAVLRRRRERSRKRDGFCLTGISAYKKSTMRSA